MCRKCYREERRIKVRGARAWSSTRKNHTEQTHTHTHCCSLRTRALARSFYFSLYHEDIIIITIIINKSSSSIRAKSACLRDLLHLKKMAQCAWCFRTFSSAPQTRYSSSLLCFVSHFSFCSARQSMCVSARLCVCQCRYIDVDDENEWRLTEKYIHWHSKW